MEVKYLPHFGTTHEDVYIAEVESKKRFTISDYSGIFVFTSGQYILFLVSIHQTIQVLLENEKRLL